MEARRANLAPAGGCAAEAGARGEVVLYSSEAEQRQVECGSKSRGGRQLLYCFGQSCCFKNPWERFDSVGLFSTLGADWRKLELCC
jgi:hypothetical protein